MAVAAVAADEPVFVAGEPRLSVNPAARTFAWLPFASRFNHRARLWILGELVLVTLAARGATRLRQQRRLDGWPGARTRLALVATALAAEVVVASPARVPLPAMDPGSPAIYRALADLPAGPGAFKPRVISRRE